MATIPPALRTGSRWARKYLAYGPEILLERAQIHTTYAWPVDEAGHDESVTRIYEGIPFNSLLRIQAADRLAKKAFQDRPGNRSRFANAADIYPFADPGEANDPQSMAAWETKHILEYLLYYHCPKDRSGNRTIGFSLFSDEYLPSGVCHEIKQHGRSVKEILDQLLDRRRLLSYVIETDPDDPQACVLRPFSFLDQAIYLDDLTLWENADQKHLLLDESILVSGLQIQESWVQFYHRVIAFGAPIVCCGTFSHAYALVPAWTDAEATAYAAAATDQAGYAHLEPYIKEHHNTVLRHEERFARVFSAFGLSKTAKWTYCGDQLPGGVPNEFFPDAIFADANRCESAANEIGIYPPSLKLAKVLPLRSDHDYRGTKIEDDAIDDNTPADGNWKYLAPLAILNLKDPDKKKEYFCDLAKSGELAAIETMGYGAGVEFSASFQIPENSAYFQLKFSAAPQHVLAKNDYDPPTNLGYYEEPPLYDWKNDLIATLAVETNCRVQVQWPDPVDAETDFLKTLWIDLSDFAALHYVAPATVVAVEDGKLIRSSSGGIIRDDRPLLKRMARLAYEWYARRRQALTLTYVGAKKYFRVGDLITELGAGATLEPIRSVVTEIRVDFGRTPKDMHHTTIHTQWAELDVARLLT